MERHTQQERQIGNEGSLVIELSDDNRKLIVEVETDRLELDKADVSWLIRKLESVRDSMER